MSAAGEKAKQETLSVGGAVTSKSLGSIVFYFKLYWLYLRISKLNFAYNRKTQGIDVEKHNKKFIKIY